MKRSEIVPLSIDETVREAAKRLADAGVDSAHLDARLLMQHILELDTAGLIAKGQDLLSRQQRNQFDHLLRRRAAREPIALIVGCKEFWGLSFEVSAETLVPRPDSETLVEVSIRHLGDRAQSQALRILDLGTGTGCLLLALLHEWPMTTGVGCDINPHAVELATRNAAQLGLGNRAVFLRSDWTSGVSGSFDLILANPPYIPESEIADLSPEVSQYEPRLALSGGADGLDAYRALANLLPHVLNPEGVVVLEVGIYQAETAKNLMFSGDKMKFLDMGSDLAGIQRCIVGQNAN